MTTQPTSGHQGLVAEQLLALSREPGRMDAERMLFVAAAIAHGLLSVSGQLGEVLAKLGEVLAIPAAEQAPDTGPLVTCGRRNPYYPSLVCCRPADHPADVTHGATPPAARGLMFTWHDSDYPSDTPIGDRLQGERIPAGEPLPARTPGAFLAAPASMADGDLGRTT
jgi:hypothetical protein